MCSEKEYKKKWSAICWRTRQGKSYVNRQIENRFRDYDEFRSCAIDKCMKPGEVVHRPDRDGHYEPGNVEFIDEKEHWKISGREKRVLTDNQVREMRMLNKVGISTHKIAKAFPISQTTCWRVCAGKAYADVE